MIKNIAYFPSQCAQNSGPVMDALTDCLQANGITVQENSMTSDAAVIWSMLWSGRMQPNREVYHHYRSQNKPVIVVEIGALYRGNTWKIAVNHIDSTGYYGQHDSLDWDRPRRLGISLALNVSANPAILVAGQHNRSHQLSRLQSQESWIANTVSQLRQYTDRPIHVRPHPRCTLNTRLLPQDIKLISPKKSPNTYDSFDMHFDYHAVVNYNSGPGIQAAISGTRPIVDATSLAHPVSISVDCIDQPYLSDRDRWLVEICHTEYTVEEIRRGIWLKRIQPALQVP